MSPQSGDAAGQVSREVVATLGGRTCPVCGQPVDDAADAGPFQLFACSACGSWCSNARFRDADTSFVPESYFENDQADLPVWQQLESRLRRQSNRVRSVLDIGCGTGAYLRHAGECFPDARRVGIELDTERAERARQRNPDATIHTGDATAALDAAAGPFDLITMWDVFEHLTEPAALMRSLTGKLSDHGCVFVQTIHEDSAVPRLGRWSYALTGGRLKGAVRRTHDAHHLVFFTRPGLETLAASAGLEILDQWWGRLLRVRMDGPAWLTATTALALRVENALGNGLFINLLLGPTRAGGVNDRATRADP